MTLDEASDVTKQIKLNPLQTHIEPSRFDGYLFDNLSAAVELRLSFNAKPWPTKCADLFLMYVEPSYEVSTWIGSCGHDYRPVEIVAIQFQSDEDQKSFEGVIWPNRVS